MAAEKSGTSAVATQSGKQQTAGEKRASARAANAQAEFAARGGRELTTEEKRQIEALRNAAKACDALQERIRNGRPVALEVVQAAALLWANAFGSFTPANGQ